MNEFILYLLKGSDGLYRPPDDNSTFMLSHLSGGCAAVNETLIEQIRYLAKAHNWEVEIV